MTLPCLDSCGRHYWRRKQFFLCTGRMRGHSWANGQVISAFHCLLLLMVPNITGQDTVLPMSLVQNIDNAGSVSAAGIFALSISHYRFAWRQDIPKQECPH